MAAPRAPLEPIVLGGDFGNATTSIARAGSTLAFFPSVLTTLGVGPYQGLSKVETSRHHISFGGKHAIVGLDAFDMPGHDTLLLENPTHPERRYTDEESFFCFLAGISAAFPTTDTLGVRLATGAPLSLYEAHRNAIVRRCRGEFPYAYNGHARRVVVEQVYVYGEGREAWRLLTAEQRRGNVAVHDLGGKTWNVLLFRDGALKASRTFDMGMERLLDGIALVPREPAARWALLQALRRDPKAYQDVIEAIEAAITEGLTLIERKVALDRAERHALMGGGGVFLPAPIRGRYRVPTIVLNGKAPESANALAYALAATAGAS